MRPMELPNGVIIWPQVMTTPDLPSEFFDASSKQGRQDGERFKAMLADLERLQAGWLPDLADLASAPLLSCWSLKTPDRAGLPYLVGFSRGHPHIRDGRIIVTSSVVALDGPTHLWARTISRFYKLGRPLDATLSS